MARRAAVEDALRLMAPGIPDHEFEAIADHAMDSAGLRRATPETAAWLSMVAYVRHVFTDYDAMLDDGYDVDSARHFVRDDIAAILTAWGVRRSLPDGDEDTEHV